ncbi:hypothetical protein ACS0TY_025166 [Phlomoides rotata]
MQARFNFELSHSETMCKARNQKKNSKVGVVCCGVEGVYFPSLQLLANELGKGGKPQETFEKGEEQTLSDSVKSADESEYEFSQIQRDSIDTKQLDE